MQNKETKKMYRESYLILARSKKGNNSLPTCRGSYEEPEFIPWSNREP